MAFPNRLTSVTQDKILPKLVEGVLNASPLVRNVLSRAKVWSGESLKVPFKYTTSASGTSFSGFDTLGTSASDTRVKLSFDAKAYAKNIALPLTEITANEGESKVLDLLSTEARSNSMDMANEIATMFYGDGTGNSSKDTLGLEAIVDDGTNTSTYGGLTRSSYTAVNSTVTGSSGTLSLAKMSTLWYNASEGTGSTEQPTSIYTTTTIISLYESLLAPQERFMKSTNGNNAMVGSEGFLTFEYKGAPIYADRKCTSGVLYMINDNYLDFYGKPMAMSQPVRFRSEIQGVSYSDLEGLGFSWGGWIKASNAAAINSYVYLFGELVSGNPRRHAKLTGITGV